MAVGMSGGMDSSVAALLLMKGGYRVVGVTLRLYDQCGEGYNGAPASREEEIRRARELCRELGVPHRVVDAGRNFEQHVVENFIEEYGRGRTPNPCVLCNERIKFPALQAAAEGIGLEKIATGHYARIVKGPRGRTFLASAADAWKDQSYFLYRVPVKVLDRTILPIGEMSKKEVGRLASGLGFGSPPFEESQDTCFLQGCGLRAFISERIEARSGDIIDTEGRVIGRHTGISHYTLGQRRGLGVSSAVPLYVQKIDAARNRIVLATEEKLYSSVAVCGSFRTRAGSFPEGLTAKVRYRHRPADVRSVERSDGKMRVGFREPQRAITPGQSLVLYRQGIVMGGGIIERAGEGGG